MSTLNTDFSELIERMKHGREIDYASFEPIYYLIFQPSDILDVKRKLPAWRAKLRNEGWDATTFSIADEIQKILSEAKMRNIWLKADAKDPLNWEKTNSALAHYLGRGALQKRLEDTLDSLAHNPKALLIISDLEALHPYLRIGSIENKLHGRFGVPTIFLYPGERTGKTRLKFLGFYPEDGNYRSVHIGG